MNALSTFVERLFFAVACVLGWVVFPMFLVAGGTALLVYASMAELLSTIMGAAAPIYRDRLADRRAARRTADRLCGPLRP
jgi:hypothetical protein